ncbi:alpha-(1,6)-fucosyltransferase-like [Mercenaria mercenaria]|uniref:alpha-(1,6)-fucosyltransferase-like n=1 Tax=Mercenaria mercenaria TaxID=6596 RepID=UPI00234F9362|nr:alpha-(1,6)-fucosyltransferase-like [Mercenaria mercenaria]
MMSLLGRNSRKRVVILLVLTGLSVYELNHFLPTLYISPIQTSPIKGVRRSNDFALNISRTERSDWKTEELHRLGDLVQRRLHYLQNPKDCENAKKILCNFTRGAGYGSQMDDWLLCLIVAYATERTLIVDSKGWRYAKQGLETVFLPLSTNCTSTKNQSVIQIKDIRNIQSIKEVVQLPRNFHVFDRPMYLPKSIPEDLAEEITRVHKNPSGWWIGQFLVYLTRQNQGLKSFIEQNIRNLGFRHPIVGLHVRKTDKIKELKKLRNLSEYMTHVEQWYDSYERRHGAAQRRIFLATDDPTVITMARESYPNYTFVNNVNASELAKKWSTRFSESSLYGLLLDIQMLSMSDFVVCTMSSNIGRRVYELMHASYWDAPARIKSLDIEYAFHYHRNAEHLTQHRNRRFTVLKDISHPHNITITLDNKRNRVKMPTYNEVPWSVRTII